MSSFLQADIFFFITSIAVVALTILLIIICIYIAKILARIRDITDTVNEEVQLIKQDIDDLREGVRDRIDVVQRSPISSIIGAIVSHIKGKKPKRRRRTSRKRTKK